MNQRRIPVQVLTWIIATTAIVLSIVAVAFSPLLQWRDPVYITAGFAGVLALALLLFQPLLAGGYLAGFSALKGRRAHRFTGVTLVILVLAHVVGLWLTSPMDVIDALLFVSPTPFSNWGVVAMWAVFATACLALLRAKLRIRPGLWRLSHKALAVVIAIGSVVHAMKVEGTMEIISKSVLCALLIAATLAVIANLKLPGKSSGN